MSQLRTDIIIGMKADTSGVEDARGGLGQVADFHGHTERTARREHAFAGRIGADLKVTDLTKAGGSPLLRRAARFSRLAGGGVPDSLRDHL